MSRTILVTARSKKFQITIPDEAVLTFGPWSPPVKNKPWREDESAGTLRVYTDAKKTDQLAMFSGVESFRDTSIEYMEEVLVQKGATVWESDEKGYVTEDKRQGSRQWVNPELPSPREGERAE